MSDDKPVILMIIPNLNFGGAQRVFYSMSLKLSKQYRVVECVFNLDLGHAFQSGNRIISLDVKGGGNGLQKFWNFLMRVKFLRKVKKELKPVLCISHLEGADLVNILSKHREKTITWVHGSKRHDENIEGFLGFIRHHILIPYTYKRADKVITVSEAIKEELVRHYQIDRRKIERVYNSFDVDGIQAKSILPIDQQYEPIFDDKKNTLVFSGRLARQKNLEIFLRWFAEFLLVSPKCRLVIIGDGELRDALLKLCADLRLKTFSVWGNSELDAHQDIYFLGFQENPFNFISRSTAFILPSLWEGFPMVIGESMACGTPIIAADCPTGPKEMLQKRHVTNMTLPYLAEYGLLLPLLKKGSFHLWSSEINALLADKEKLKDFALRSMDRANDFSKTENCQQLLKLIKSEL